MRKYSPAGVPTISQMRNKLPKKPLRIEPVIERVLGLPRAWPKRVRVLERPFTMARHLTPAEKAKVSKLRYDRDHNVISKSEANEEILEIQVRAQQRHDIAHSRLVREWKRTIEGTKSSLWAQRMLVLHPDPYEPPGEQDHALLDREREEIIRRAADWADSGSYAERARKFDKHQKTLDAQIEKKRVKRKQTAEMRRRVKEASRARKGEHWANSWQALAGRKPRKAEY